jgi:Arc/MetJ family transcription regulator
LLDYATLRPERGSFITPAMKKMGRLHPQHSPKLTHFCSPEGPGECGEVEVPARESESIGATISACGGGDNMRTTLALDDDLLARAQALTGISEKAALVRAALHALIQRESSRRLALLGGSQPRLEDVPRRQTEPA